MYFCESTSWRPWKLRTVEDFFFDIDKTKPDLLSDMIMRDQCREEVTSVSELNAKEKEIYDTYVRRYKQMNFSCTDDVKKLILRELHYS